MDTENTPLILLLNKIINDYNETLRSLLGSFDTIGTSGSDFLTVSKQRKQLVQNIILIDELLTKLYTKIHEHQNLQERIRKTRLNFVKCDQIKVSLATKFYDSKKQLERVLLDSEETSKTAKVYTKFDMDIDELINYSQRISSFTAAPPGYVLEKSILPAEPPYPIELVMRAGILNQYKTQKTQLAEQKTENEIDTEYLSFIEDNNTFDIEADEFLLDLDLNPDLE
ncbi:hypothetical protein BB559_000080 [Furculomyces boomerangus]|uniref:Mediator of RNA polymerase II transcription subunit 4 n=1 Tax=Furculomyces boomerangus TaxID=61424 RepID=A0A2T9Z6B9_9FUNG|nr:hypothetical protein BB559_000080 [Furculomyces boomerangus]